jgi:tRNA-specific 2-thiouridylase
MTAPLSLQHPSPLASSTRRVMVGLSGGVDSSVAAHLLQAQGFAIEALFMKNWDEDDAEQCSAAQDLADARSVSAMLGIPLHARNFSAEYWERVFAGCLAEFRAGRTPNPDVLCNREIKFNVFIEHALALGADCIATGHYARIDGRDGTYRLLKACDAGKDQSYFLHLLTQEQLARAIFPLGSMLKSEVRARAAAAGFVTHDKKDSTGICFIGERKFMDFLSHYLPARPGDIVTESGQVIGQHDGVMYYTIGQRKGLHIGGRRDAEPQPWYVARKNVSDNTLLVVQGENHALLFRSELIADQVHWISGHAPESPLHCTAKTRYRQPDQSCIVAHLDDARVHVRFTAPQRAVTPGQSVVFYSGDECLGGGVISA